MTAATTECPSRSTFGGIGPAHSVQVEPMASREIGFHVLFARCHKVPTRSTRPPKCGLFLELGCPPCLTPGALQRPAACKNATPVCLPHTVTGHEHS